MHHSQAQVTLPEFDLQFQRSGIRYLCGIDEAGRGPLAGPVVAAAVILPYEPIEQINDSKLLSEKARQALDRIIREKALSFGLGAATVDEIEQFNILQATFLAMRRAVGQLHLAPDYILVDGRDFPLFNHPKGNGPIPGQALIKGDRRSQTVAAASILAKVHRDALMTRYAEQYPDYGFERHKGYGTKAHRQKILEFGPSPIHRKKFIRNILNAGRQTRLF